MKIIYPFTASFLDYPDKESLAVTVYFTGCEHNCEGCHSPALKNYLYSGAVDFTIPKFIEYLQSSMRMHRTDKVVFMGGDPLSSYHFQDVKNILSNYSIGDVCIYTGYEIEELLTIKRLPSGFKFVKAGGYKKDLKQFSEKTDEYIQFASTNQKLYDSQFNLVSENGRHYFRQ